MHGGNRKYTKREEGDGKKKEIKEEEKWEMGARENGGWRKGGGDRADEEGQEGDGKMEERSKGKGREGKGGRKIKVIVQTDRQAHTSDPVKVKVARSRLPNTGFRS